MFIVDYILFMEYMLFKEWMMAWDAEYTDEFGKWWDTLTENQQDSITATVELLMEYGP